MDQQMGLERKGALPPQEQGLGPADEKLKMAPEVRRWKGPGHDSAHLCGQQGCSSATKQALE